MGYSKEHLEAPLPKDPKTLAKLIAIEQRARKTLSQPDLTEIQVREVNGLANTAQLSLSRMGILFAQSDIDEFVFVSNALLEKNQ